MSLVELINKYDVNDIEKGIVLNYLETNGIGQREHPFFKEYLSIFVPDVSLKRDIESLRHTSLAELAVDMELLIPMNDRETNGAFFTPQLIVDYIINSIQPDADARVIDISCGSGAFLLGILRYYGKKFGKSVQAIVDNNLFGVDILAYNVRRSKILIMLYALSKDEIVSESSIKVVCDNSLTRHWVNSYDAVIGNPPYVKFQDMSDDTRNLLLNRFVTTSFGTFNLYFSFFEIGYQILKKGGRLGFITP